MALINPIQFVCLKTPTYMGEHILNITFGQHIKKKTICMCKENKIK